MENDNTFFQFLFEQFRRRANAYFLIVGVFSMADSVSPIRPETTLVPLAVIIFIGMIREIFEDSVRFNGFENTMTMTMTAVQKRLKMDWVDNRTLSKCWNGTEFVDLGWKDIKVGDVVLVREDEEFPADLLLLQSSQQNGTCNIQTSNLDGETNLKVKKSIKTTADVECSSDGSDYCVHRKSKWPP